MAKDEDGDDCDGNSVLSISPTMKNNFCIDNFLMATGFLGGIGPK
jgi:hypothetical protein